MAPSNTSKSFLPLAASLTLLCIATSVSLATVAWINGLPTANLYSENLQVTNYRWGPNCAYIDVALYNNGTQTVLLRSVKVNSQPAAVVYIAGTRQIGRGELVVLRVSTASVQAVTYQIAFQTAKGNRFVYTAVAE
ncbi:MAG: hypothetical protein ACPLIG_07005 [Candidatus Bathyarchaeales archaeon]